MYVLRGTQMSRFHKPLQADDVKPCMKTAEVNLQHWGSYCMFEGAGIMYAVVTNELIRCESTCTLPTESFKVL